MRNINCRHARRQIEEAGTAELLSSSVNNHLLSCVTCETLLREQTKLRELVSSLGTVEAPGDFEFRLRARLAGEKRGAARPFALGNLSLGLRSAAVATILLLLGSALMFVSFRNPSNSGSTGVAKIRPKDGDPNNLKNIVKPVGAEVVAGDKNQAVAFDPNVKSLDQPDGKRRQGLKQSLASLRESSRARSRDLSSTPAEVLKRDRLAAAYQTAAFPIDTGYQSLKVSVDDARGTSRTISLPTVSFGSQRSLSQSASPLLASARGAW
jgi:hypothetical protein